MNVTSMRQFLLASLFFAGTAMSQTISNPSFEDGYPTDPALLPFYSNQAAPGWSVWNRYENFRGPEWINTSSPDWAHGVASGVPGASDGAFYMMLDSLRTTEVFESISGNVYAEGGIRTAITGLVIGSEYYVSFDAFSLQTNFVSQYKDEGFIDLYLAENLGDLNASLIGSVFITDAITFDTGFSGIASQSIGSYGFSFIATAEAMEFGLRSRMLETDPTSLGLFVAGVDNFAINVVPVPEPSGAFLVGMLGAYVLLKRRRFSR